MYIEDRDDESVPKKGKRIDSFSEVLEALDSLDGDRRSLLLVAEGGPVPESGYPYAGMAMEIAGGPAGYTCVAYTPDCKEVFALSSNGEGDEGYRTINRPYPDQVPANEVVDKNSIIKAVKSFAKGGELDPEFKWAKYS